MHPSIASLSLNVRRGAAAAVLSSLFCTSGCFMPHRLKVDYKGYEAAFAETSNSQMLLNLARLQNHDPTFFFKMGQISEQYRINGSLSGAGNYVAIGTTGAGNVQGGGTPSAVFENTPTFQFIPVTDDTNAQLVLKQIPAQTFYILYQQGWRIDQLLRLMVDRVEVTIRNNKDNTCHVSTYRNVPPMMNPGPDGAARDKVQLSNYVTFLRIAAIAYGLQKHGDLLLRGIAAFVPIDNQSVATAPAAAGVSASDVEKAAEKNLSFETVNNKLLIGQAVVNPKFYLIPPKNTSGHYEPDIAAINMQLTSDPELVGLGGGSALGVFLSALSHGFSISGDSTTPEDAEQVCPTTDEQPNVHLVLRSLLGAMSSAAQEQELFDVLHQNNSRIPRPDGSVDPSEAARFNSTVPPIEQVPLLRIFWKTEEDDSSETKLPHILPTPPLVVVEYRDQNYLIADPKYPNIPENTYWNRDVFRLISALAAQVTVDTSKYQVPDILQLRTN